jgi:hemoglobin
MKGFNIMKKSPLMKKSLCAAVVAAALFHAGPGAGAGTLYDDLGAREGLTKIVNVAIDLSLEDPRIKDTFDNTNIVRLKRLLVDQLCVLSGGPCTYEGRDMAESHASKHLTNAHFNALVEDLQIAMDQANVSFATQNKLLAILAPMQRDVVTK